MKKVIAGIAVIGIVICSMVTLLALKRTSGSEQIENANTANGNIIENNETEEIKYDLYSTEYEEATITVAVGGTVRLSSDEYGIKEAKSDDGKVATTENSEVKYCRDLVVTYPSGDVERIVIDEEGVHNTGVLTVKWLDNTNVFVRCHICPTADTLAIYNTETKIMTVNYGCECVWNESTQTLFYVESQPVSDNEVVADKIMSGKNEVIYVCEGTVYGTPVINGNIMAFFEKNNGENVKLVLIDTENGEKITDFDNVTIGEIIFK